MAKKEEAGEITKSTTDSSDGHITNKVELLTKILKKFKQYEHYLKDAEYFIKKS
jgi:hypothetical protein